MIVKFCPYHEICNIKKVVFFKVLKNGNFIIQFLEIKGIKLWKTLFDRYYMFIFVGH